MQRHARCLAHDEPGQFSRFAQEKETTTSSHSSSCRVVSTTECRNCPPTRLAPLRRDSLRCQLARVGNEARQTACNPVQSAEPSRSSARSAERRLAEREGFEPPCRLPDKTLSRRPRYDHFGTSPFITSLGWVPFFPSPPPAFAGPTSAGFGGASCCARASGGLPRRSACEGGPSLAAAGAVVPAGLKPCATECGAPSSLPPLPPSPVRHLPASARQAAARE